MAERMAAGDGWLRRQRHQVLSPVTSVLKSQRARVAAEDLADRLARLTRATLAMNGAADFDELVLAIADGAASIFSSPAVALVISPDGVLRRAVADPDDDAGVLDIVPIQLLRELTTPATTSGVLELVPVDWRAVAPELNQSSQVALAEESGEDDAAFAALFGSRGGQPLGIALRTPALPEEGKDLLAQLGQAAVLATDSLRLYTEEHTLALTLQRSFLTVPPPRIAGLELGVRYVPAAHNAEIGGDFYEFLELDGGRLLVAIGDVAGHSIHAATVMVELRHALRAYAVEGYGPAEILTWLDRMLRRYHEREFATMCVLVLDVGRNELRVANAGHLPPLLAGPARTDYLDVHGPMLGLGRDRAPDTVLELPRACSIVLITDGLIEAPGIDLDDALEQLRALSSPESSPDQLCEQMLDHFSPAGRDDIALLVLRRPG